MDAETAPVVFRQVPVVTGQLVLKLIGQSRTAEDIHGFSRGDQLADDGIDAHPVVHMGMTDEDRLEVGEGSFGQVVDLSTVEHQVAARWGVSAAAGSDHRSGRAKKVGIRLR